MNVSEFLQNENIFEYAAVPYDSLIVTDKRRDELIRREFMPKTAVFFLMPYYVDSPPSNISRYAHSRDYHLFVKELKERAKEFLDVPFALFSDTSPVNEVAGCVEAGLGCVGKNGLLINRRYGSYVFIGELFFSLPFDHEFFKGCEKREKKALCLMCNACERACPTGALSDKSRCISFINQKKRLDEGDEALILESGLLWGCDTCQEVCPMNTGEQTPIEFFRKDRIEKMTGDVLDALVLSGSFSERAYAWRGESVLRRNLKIFEKEGLSK